MFKCVYIYVYIYMCVCWPMVSRRLRMNSCAILTPVFHQCRWADKKFNQDRTRQGNQWMQHHMPRVEGPRR